MRQGREKSQEMGQLPLGALGLHPMGSFLEVMGARLGSSKHKMGRLRHWSPTHVFQW